MRLAPQFKKKINEAESRKSYIELINQNLDLLGGKNNTWEKPFIIRKEGIKRMHTDRLEEKVTHCWTGVAQNHNRPLCPTLWKQMKTQMKWSFLRQYRLPKLVPAKTRNLNSLFSQEKWRKLWRSAERNRKKKKRLKLVSSKSRKLKSIFKCSDSLNVRGERDISEYTFSNDFEVEPS